PVADLLSVAPDIERILFEERTCDHRDHRVVLVTSGTVHGEVTTGGRSESTILAVGAEGHLSHQLGPAIHIVRIKGRSDRIFRKVDGLARVRLQPIWV